jgi:hypothetical protein
MDRNHSISDCFVSSQARDEATEELHELLKAGSTPLPSTTTGDDEGRVVPGETQVYEDPPGVETAPPDNEGFSAAVVAEGEKDRQGVLNRSELRARETRAVHRALHSAQGGEAEGGPSEGRESDRRHTPADLTELVQRRDKSHGGIHEP